MTLAQIIGDDICTRREALGLSQAYVAEQLGWWRPVYARFERGKHMQTIGHLALVARILDCTLLELIGPALESWESTQEGAA